MNALSRFAAGTAWIVVAACSSPPPAEMATPSDPNVLRDVEAFSAIRDRRARSVALFEEAGKVLQHPRCVNCHPAGERPTQTDRMQPHVPLVVRGKDGHGAPGLRCDTCHHAANYDAARVPGHPQWHVAPIEMAWQGRTLGQICEQIKDPARNGGKDMEALLHHMAEDSLVGWGWAPGADRTPAPGSQAQFGALLRAWADTGAHCPASDASRGAAGP
jgi:hypothetical protein